MKSKIVYSHNDYWCKHQIYDAIAYGCDMVEADIIYMNNKIILSHSWRPFSFMCYGNLEDNYLKPLSQFCKDNPDKTMWMYVEFKDSNKHIIELLHKLFKQYQTKNLRYTVSALGSKWYQKKRYETAMKFYKKYKDEFSLLWKETELEQQYQVISVDLYPESIWHF